MHRQDIHKGDTQQNAEHFHWGLSSLHKQAKLDWIQSRNRKSESNKLNARMIKDISEG